MLGRHQAKHATTFSKPMSSRPNAASNSFIASSFFLFLSSSFSSFRFLASSCNFLATRPQELDEHDELILFLHYVTMMSLWYEYIYIYIYILWWFTGASSTASPRYVRILTSSCQHSQHPDPESFCFLFLSLLFFTRCNSCKHVFYFLVGLVD